MPAGQRFGALSQVHVVDSKRWQTRRRGNELEREQTRTASHVVYSWQDHADEARAVAVRQQVRRLNPRARDTSEAELTQALQTLVGTPADQLPRTFVSVFDPPTENPFRLPALPGGGAPRRHANARDRFTVARQGLQAPHQHDPAHALAHRYTALQIELPRRLHPLQLVNWLESLPPNVIRAKGIVEFADSPGRFHFFQRVEDTVAFDELPCDPPENLTLALLVGIELDEPGLRHRMEQCLKSDAPGPVPTEQASGKQGTRRKPASRL